VVDRVVANWGWNDLTFGRGARLITGLTRSRMSPMEAVSQTANAPNQEDSQKSNAEIESVAHRSQLEGLAGSLGDANCRDGATWSPRSIADPNSDRRARGRIREARRVGSIDGGYGVDCEQAFHLRTCSCA
jgi:hypothetical protein